MTRKELNWKKLLETLKQSSKIVLHEMNIKKINLLLYQ